MSTVQNFGRVSRVLIAPDQRLTDDLVLIRAGEMPQKSLASFLVNERSERTAFLTSPSVQLDRNVARRALRFSGYETNREVLGRLYSHRAGAVSSLFAFDEHLDGSEPQDEIGSFIRRAFVHKLNCAHRFVL
jgi:hypothetical protein